MKLSRLVAYRNHLEDLTITDAGRQLDSMLAPMIHTITSHELQFGNFGEKCTLLQQDIKNSLLNFDSTIADLKTIVQKVIEDLEPHYFRESYRLYSGDMCNDTVEHMLSRRPQLSEEVAVYLRSRIMRHSDWRYPGMIIRPGREDWINDLVSLDPMYLVDIDAEMFTPCLQSFPLEYQQRVRTYIIKEYNDDFSLAALPQQQMGFVLAYNYLNYKPLEMIRLMLQEIHNCLRPGGTLVFTFNDCDRAGGVELAERAYMCYTPGRLVLAAAEMQDYEIVHSYYIDAAIRWIELRKPGRLENHRGGQALARIVARNNKSQ